MSLRNTLNRLMRVVIEEAERNPEFEAALNEALGAQSLSKRKQPKEAHSTESSGGEFKRGKNRRPPAALDPVQVVRDGETALRAALEKLSLDQLRDIVAEYGMDPSRLVMKWVDSARVIDRIVELSTARARKGDAFRKPTDDPQQSHPEEPGSPAAASGDTPPNISSEGEPPLKP
ncbi:TPA: hypothetical protein SAO13_001387 [Burkholderia multivorans]|uniref:hypothetical protein n=1 Tax=Burkholderia multivorans TaxID=87883 RepID=UPI00158FA3FC|nr:hypothetical protein [Burkholderia multivorans]MBU9238748.1 hypothetical protein [Burkholderia multivorans]HEF4747429.1 hypothetical protein [Burkholderia multivorans]